jgi:ribosome maturation factor RimP
MKDITEMTRQALAGMDVELVDIERAALGLLRVTIDRPDGVRIEDCEQVSRQLSHVFEVEGIDYKRLEVGSPGVDRPLRTLRDFDRFVGERIEVRLNQAVDNQRIFSGQLYACDNASAADGSKQFEIEYQVKKGELKRVAFQWSDVERAKLDPLLDFKGRKR